MSHDLLETLIFPDDIEAHKTDIWGNSTLNNNPILNKFFWIEKNSIKIKDVRSLLEISER